MDLRLLLRVFWRFRLLMLAGILLGLALAFLSQVRVDLDGVKPDFAYRQQEVWRSQSTLFVTEKGFPSGRTTLPLEPSAGGFISRYADYSRYVDLAVLYSELVYTDEVRSILRRSGPIRGRYRAAPVVTEADTESALNAPPLIHTPFLNITTFSHSPELARNLAARVSRALQEYVNLQQQRNNIAPARRVRLDVVKHPTRATLFTGRSPIRAVVIFGMVVMMTLVLAAILENMRPRVQLVPSHTRLRPLADPQQRASQHW
jgi:hypothetical protein